MEIPALPLPGSDELHQLVTNAETRVVYEVLYETRDEPLDMIEIRDRVTLRTGSANEHTGRRLRDLRTHFDVEVVPTPGVGPGRATFSRDGTRKRTTARGESP